MDIWDGDVDAPFVSDENLDKIDDPNKIEGFGYVHTHLGDTPEMGGARVSR